MKKFNFASRVIAMVLIMVMVVSLIPTTVLAAINDIATGTAAGDTGIDNDTLGDDGTINWPIKVYDYLADGMLFEYPTYTGSTITSSADSSYGGGQYVLGKPMPYAALGTDYTTDSAYSESAYDYQFNSAGRGVRYTRTAVAAVNNTSPRYLRLKINTSSSSSGNRNFYVSDFINDNGANQYYNNVRYMVMVYRSSGMPTSTTTDYFGTSMAPMSFLIYLNNSSWTRYNVTSWTNSTTWTYRVIDLYSLGWTSGYTPNLSITPNFNNTGDYLDISHVAYFTTSAAATEYGKQCLEFNKDPGEYVSGTSWNASNNGAFGLLYPSNGNAWSTGGGSPTTATNGVQGGYYTHQIGYRIPEYYSSADTYNSKRLDGKDSAGRYNGTGNLMGENGIYFITSSYYTSTQYQTDHPDATSFDMSELDFGGYNLLTKATKGLWTAGLLQGTLGADGTPQYKQETVEYIADLLSKTLTIPQKGSNGANNYNFVAGVKNAEQYGSTNGVANDLAQALRNELGIKFTSGAVRGSTPTMGTYADTIAKADKLKGKFLTVADNNYIKTCMDAAYYLLNNLFVDDSYNQTQDDFRYLTLSSAEMDNGDTAFVFDGGFSTGADPSQIGNGLTQDQYKAQTQSAVEYNGYNIGGDGTISLGPVQAKDMYYYSGSSTTTRYPFLPVIDSEGTYAGQTESYYFLEDGKRNYDTEYGTYAGRNYNYVLASNGEFVYTEEDNLFFEFEGDDDVYLYINGQLVLDLGGGHSISNSSFNVNDYVVWARNVLKNPSGYSAEEIARAEALDLVNGEIASFDFYYMERHGFGANMRIVTNMHITDPALRVEKTAYQGGKQIEYGGIVDADDPIEYNFKVTNSGNTKLYNLTFDDSDIGVSLTPEKGLYVEGDDNDTELDDINGYIVTDALGGKLEAQDLTAVITGYQQVDSGGDYVKSGREYTKVEAGTGTHVYYDAITVNFDDNQALINFLKTLESDKTDNETVDEELTQSGSGLWVDSSVTFKGIYYTMTGEQEDAGVFNNTVKVTAYNKSDKNAAGVEKLESEARHRVYVTAIPSYYQWAGHDLFIPEKLILDDASAEAGNTGSMLNDYKAFFDTVNGDTEAIYTTFADRMGNRLSDDDYEFADFYTAADGLWGVKTNYDTPGIYEFYLLMYLKGKSGEISTMNLGEYAVVRVLIIVTDVEDAQYVLDYGLKTENLDINGELFKNDELYGSMSGTMSKLMGVSSTKPAYLNVEDKTSDYNRIDFDAMAMDDSNKIDMEDGYYTFNMAIPEEGKTINYDEHTNIYSLTDAGTTLVHADVPLAWEEMYLYYWYDDGRNNVWPGTPMEMRSHGNFELAIPGNVPHIILSNGTNQTSELHVSPGKDLWIDIPGDKFNNENNLLASIEYKTAEGIIHAAVPDDWGDVYLYCWDAFGTGLVEWPGTKIDTKDSNGYYTYNIPGDITNVIINNGKDNHKQTSDLVVYAGEETWITVNNNNPSYSEDTGNWYYGATSSRSDKTVTMHATVPSSWNRANIYYWNSNGSATGVAWPGIAMTKNEDGTYSVDNIPADVTNIIINDVLMEGDKVVDGGSQTGDLMITPGIETWVTVNDIVSNTSVEAKVPSDWGQAYFYFFNDSGDVGPAWPGTAGLDLFGDGTYSIKAPVGATKVIVNNNSGRQTEDILMVLNASNKYTISSDNNTVSRSDTTLTITVPDDWNEVYVHYWNDSTGGTGWPGEAATKGEDGKYTFTIPAGKDKFLINNNNNGKQTDDITMFYLGGENIINVDTSVNGNNHNNYSLSSSEVVETQNSANITYGENAQAEGFTFTPTDFMDSSYNLYMALTVHETDINTGSKPTKLGEAINIGKEVQMYKKISVLPANVVYYEDDFAGITYKNDTASVITHYGSGSGSLSQSVDQNQEYGQDSVYQTSDNDEMTGGSLTDVLIKDINAFAEFSFTGTGFEIIGHTHAVEDGTLVATIFDANGNQVKKVTVITEFDNGADGGTDAIVSVPLIRVDGLDFGKYRVELSGIPILDFSNWDHVSTTLPVKTSYVCIDGVRIYQPLDNSADITRENLALGKTYVAQIAEAASLNGDYYDAQLTDGVYATAIDYANRSQWFGFHKTLNAADGVGYVTVDLGEEYNLDTFRMHLSPDDSGANIGQPAFVEVAVSSDGVNYELAGNLNVTASATAAYWAALELDTAQTGRYVRFYVYNNASGLYWNFINEVEIYGTETVAAGKNDAYLDTESGAAFSEIRDLITERQAFAIKYSDVDGLSVSGGTTTWTENRNNALPSDHSSWTSNIVNSVNDYLLAGPNNEVYMVEAAGDVTSALAFYVTENDSDVHNMQIGIRGVDYSAFTGAAATGLINAQIQYGADVNGELVWKTLTTMDSTTEQYFTIPYTECPYDEENNRYQVVIRVADTDVTGMASFTTLKYNGLDLCTLNSSEIPDVIYDDELNNFMVDSFGNTVDTSKFVGFIDLVDQMTSDKVVEGGGTSVDKGDIVVKVEGKSTSSLGALADTFTADTTSDFVLTENSRLYIVSSESVKPSEDVQQTVKLVQSQFAADSLPTAEPMEIVWGSADYAKAGDILIYVNSGYNYGDEEYRLVVSDKAQIYSKDVDGLLYGLNTLQKHFRAAGTNAIKGFTTQDMPDTKERTIHLDCARKYLTKDWICNYIREMSWMGYNAIEIHFSEDGGFRMDFWDPEYFTSPTGNDFSWICGSDPAPWVLIDDPDQGKYLKADEIIEILEVAKEYHMEVIPSFDTPAHVGYMTELYYNTVKSNPNSSIRKFNYNGKSYTLPTQINYRNQATYDFSVLDLSKEEVRNFAYALYADIAAFFQQYAGSTKFNIGADEVGLNSSDRWQYNDFISYVNSLNSLLKSYGYTTRMYNDFIYNTTYTSATTGIDNDIEIVYWSAPKASSSPLRPASFFANQGRTIYSGVNFWTYYVLRLADASSVSAANKGRDARDPKNTWWDFYRNGEDSIYNEWDPTLLSAYNYTKYNLTNDQLGGGYFMVWCDYGGLNTEVEMWNGVYDKTGVSGTSGNFYSLRERMWSNAIKQWNIDINSSLTFANYETLRDKLGDFPGLGTATNACSQPTVLPKSTELSDTAYRPEYTVTFKNPDGTVLSTQTVIHGGAATAPADPTRVADVWYTYTFAGWDTDFSNITGDTVVTATYTETATTAGTIGYLDVKVSGGTNFNISVNDSAAIPMGTEYINASMAFGAKVTVTAESTNDNRFMGWINAKTGEVLTSERSYTFYTSGNDVMLALFDTDIANKGTVIFRNDKTNQILDMQYYASTDTIAFPDDPAFPGYEFVGWDHTEAEIQSKLAEGKDVTVRTVWSVKDVYFTIDVVGGSVTKNGGMFNGKYVGYKGTTVSANAAPSGKVFAYWINEDNQIVSYDTEYKFYPYEDTTLEAVYLPKTYLAADIVGTMAEPEKPETDTDTDTETQDTFTVYFTNNWLWSDVRVYYWGVAGAPEWSGVEMTNYDTNADGHEIYTAELPVGVTGMIINGLKDDGSGNRDQTPDITSGFVDGRGYSMTWDNGNQVVIDDSRVETSEGTTETAQTNIVYLQVSSDWAQADAWFAAYVWDDSDNNAWYPLTNVIGDIYTAEIPVKYNHIKFTRMNPASTELNWDNRWNESANLTVSPTDKDNMFILSPGWDGLGTSGNMNDLFFINDRGWDNVYASYTDAAGTVYKVEMTLDETGENSNNTYSMLIPSDVQNITFSSGNGDESTYTVSGKLTDRAIFQIATKNTVVDYQVITNVDIDTTTLGDSNTVFFSWSVPEASEYTFVNAGVLLVKEENYSESTFATGTIDSDVIQFVPAKRYQTETGMHSVTLPNVNTGDTWVARSFVQYRDASGILRTAYSDVVTATK